MASLPDPTGALSPEAQALYDELVSKRGRIDGMYRSLLNHPELARRVSDLGTFLRFGAGSLPDAVRELVILWLARKVGAAYEWVKHEPQARSAGLSEAVIAALQAGQEPAGLNEVQQAALEAARGALELKSIPRDLQESLAGHIGLSGVIELVVLVGFYRMIAGIIFTFEVPLPEGAIAPF
ncbi:MAG: carboxymuconolactone decarboxylase family protein [Syntrophobacterales bacterium]|nr:carboxymuconolactone decarboxylase family protein [Syntrophobacterales bacterium]